jgi:4-hydroxybenzoate polyprenyl transferase
MSLISLHSYIHLTRLNKPVGILLLYIPCLWGIALCEPSLSWQTIVLWSLVFLLGAIAMRSAGCILNDLFDARIDARVERTKTRPLAVGTLNKYQALGAFFICLLCGGLVWLFLTPLAKLIALGALLLLCVYPLMKRVFVFPQLILGLAFNTGILIVVAHLDSSLFNTPKPYTLYAAGIFWTLYYDTIYALQDVRDDVLIGVKSTAVYFRDSIKKALIFFYMMLSLCITYLGYLLGADYWFYLAILLGIVVDVGVELRRLDPQNSRQAAHLFMQSVLIGLAIIFLILWP